MNKYYDLKRIEGLILKEGDKVYLLRRHIKTKRLSLKLDYTKLRLFKIKRAIGKVNFELDIPKHMRIHPIFYTALLKLAPDNATLDKEPPEIDDDFEEPSYEVEVILDAR